jgi:hypothetical protein
VSRIWYSELAVMLLLLAITIAATAKGSPTVRRSALLGGLSGLLVLTDSTMVLYLVLLLLWMLFARGVKLPRFIASVIVWGLAAGVVVSPWALRNWFVLGSPQIVKSNFGLELFLGNNPFSSGTTKQEEQAFAALDQEEYAYYRAQPERVYYRYLQDKALEWIRAHLASDVPAIRGLRKPISNISRRLRRSTSSESARGWTMGDPPRPGNRHSLPL